VDKPVLEANDARSIGAGLAAIFARPCLNHNRPADAILLDITAVFPYFSCTQSMKTGHECLVTKNDNNSDP
jgi:hypothetical protein